MSDHAVRNSIMSSFIILSLLPSLGSSLRHSFTVSHDSRQFIGPIGAPFGFLRDGCFELDVFDFTLTVAHKHHRHQGARKKRSKSAHDQDTAGISDEDAAVLSHYDSGLLLKRFHSTSDFVEYQDKILSNRSDCIFEPFRTTSENEELFHDDAYNDDAYMDTGDILTAATDGIFLPLRSNRTSLTTASSIAMANIMYNFHSGEEGLYILMYQICPKHGLVNDPHEIRSNFELDFHYKNFDSLANESYLTAGEMPLPTVFFYFSVSYSICMFIWISNIRRIQAGLDGHLSSGGGRPTVFPIHHLMSVLLILKTLSVFFESVRYHYIRLSGHADLWSVVYFGVSFLKGTFLFTVILLIGSGWSFVKPFLTDREKKVIFLVLLLQVIDNLAIAVLSNETIGESAYADWNAVLHLVDILCCCAVLIPIVWQVNSLESSLEQVDPDTGEGVSTREQPSSSDNARTLSKLKMFRTFYCLVVAYIYFTRILVYLLGMLDYRHTWIRYFLTELATLVFYVVTGLCFRPMNENPYLTVSKREDEGKHTARSEQEEVELRVIGGSKDS